MIKKAYIPKLPKDGDYDLKKLISGLKTLAVEIQEVNSVKDIPQRDDHYVVVGDVKVLRSWRKQLSIPDYFVGDYPERLSPHYGRKIEIKTLHDVFEMQEGTVFLKPMEKGVFHPSVVTLPLVKSLVAFLHLSEKTKVFVQPPIKLVAEWRVFILGGKVLDVKRYNGTWDKTFDISFIKDVSKVNIGHQAYCLDVGLCKNNNMYVIEVNRAESFGSYGLNKISYAEMVCMWFGEIWERYKGTSWTQ